MAIKGNFNNSSSSSSNGGNRGRLYGVMLLIAFGAALLGVLVVHKLRERRIFNLLVTDKEQQLFSLHLLLQKEREQSSEMKRKAEEMKAVMQKVTTEKMVLERRVVELQSTIDSLKDEGKTLEIALEEKQSEIKLLTRDATPDDGDKENNPKVAAALTESLKQKEPAIPELKKHHHRRHRGVKNPAKVLSAGSDDDPSSNPLSTNGTKVADDAVVVGQEKKDDVARKLSDGENAIASKDGSDNRRKLSKEEGSLPAAVDTSQGKRNHVHSRKARGKQWKVVARNRWLGNNKMSHENSDEEEGEEGKRSATSIVEEVVAAADESSANYSGAQLSKPENSEDSLKREDRLGKGTSKLEEGKVMSQTDGVAADGSSENAVNKAGSTYNKESESVSDSLEQEEQERDEYKEETDPSEF